MTDSGVESFQDNALRKVVRKGDGDGSAYCEEESEEAEERERERERGSRGILLGSLITGEACVLCLDLDTQQRFFTWCDYKTSSLLISIRSTLSLESFVFFLFVVFFLFTMEHNSCGLQKIKNLTRSIANTSVGNECVQWDCRVDSTLNAISWKINKSQFSDQFTKLKWFTKY